MPYKEAEAKAATLKEALPYLREFKGQPVVVKYGGNISEAKLDAIMEDVAFLKHVGINPIVVHGGGPQINKAMEKAGIQTKRFEGERLTDRKAMVVVGRVLGEMNRHIVGLLNKHGVSAKSLHGFQDKMLLATSAHPEGPRTGRIVRVNPQRLRQLLKNHVPVVSPIGMDENGNYYNLNADTAAAAIAVAVKAKKLTILTNVDGVMEGDRLHSSLTVHEARHKIGKGVITEGMIPKVNACITAVEGRVPKAHLLNGERPHALLLEIFTKKGIGTQIVKN